KPCCSIHDNSCCGI
uniref:Conotoxin tx5c n=1 Tax=Conus textile TaxID=6494 RepID=CT5C_CONTE|nr:RecName: Full=Conotoxin tx5c; AltName: Full=Conotoxin 2; Contains: RecName: Full=Conotoxin tx5c-b; Contains: RecName: Full=Conotoxin tx5c-c [Conus textile]